MMTAELDNIFVQVCNVRFDEKYEKEHKYQNIDEIQLIRMETPIIQSNLFHWNDYDDTIAF